MFLNSLRVCLSREGMIPSVSIISWIVSGNTVQSFADTPLSNTIEGVFFGGICGTVIEGITPIPLRPFISGALLATAGITAVGRSCRYIKPAVPIQSRLIINSEPQNN